MFQWEPWTLGSPGPTCTACRWTSQLLLCSSQTLPLGRPGPLFMLLVLLVYSVSSPQPLSHATQSSVLFVFLRFSCDRRAVCLFGFAEVQTNCLCFLSFWSLFFACVCLVCIFNVLLLFLLQQFRRCCQRKQSSVRHKRRQYLTSRA